MLFISYLKYQNFSWVLQILLDRFPAWLKKSGDGPITWKSGFKPCQGSATYKRSPMGECDTHLEFYMFKDSIGVTELGVGQTCTAQGQFKSRKGAKRSPLRQPCDNLATMKASIWNRQKPEELHTHLFGTLVPRPISWEWFVGTWLKNYLR